MTDNKYPIIEKFRKEGTRTYFCYVQTPYGICLQSFQNWSTGKIPSIQSAINKTEYFQNYSNDIHENGFEILSTYINSKTPLKIKCNKKRSHYRTNACNSHGKQRLPFMFL